MATKPKPTAKPAAKRATAARSLVDIDTTGMTPEQVAALAEETAGAGKRKASPRSNKNWKVTELAGLSQEERDAAMDKVAAELTKPKRKPRNKVSTKTQKVPGKPEAPKDDEKRTVGRPSGFTQEIADLICEALAEGHSLRKICEADNMPNKGTVFRWLAQNKQFSDQYARAREEQADCLFDDMLAIADDGRNDTYEDDEGRLRTDHDVIARSKLRVETRKWMAGKLRPKVYGDRVDVNHGAQPDNPLTMLLQQVNGTALPVVKGNADS